MKSIKIDLDYIKECLDAREMPTDPETVDKAFERWIEVIASYEDDYFTEVMVDMGIKSQSDNPRIM